LDAAHVGVVPQPLPLLVLPPVLLPPVLLPLPLPPHPTARLAFTQTGWLGAKQHPPE
jgi:hypothetical protein